MWILALNAVYFLPYSEMRGHVSPGQLVWIKLYRDKTGRPAVSMRVEEEMLKASKPAVGVKVGDSVTGTIYNILPEGFFILLISAFWRFCIAVKFPAGVWILVRRSRLALLIFVRMAG